MCCAHKRGRLFFCGCFTMPRRMPHAGWGFTGGACTGRNHPGDRNGNGGVDTADIMTICREFPRQGIFDKGQAVCGAIRFLRTKMHLPAYIGIRDPPKRAKKPSYPFCPGGGRGPAGLEARLQGRERPDIRRAGRAAVLCADAAGAGAESGRWPLPPACWSPAFAIRRPWWPSWRQPFWCWA